MSSLCSLVSVIISIHQPLFVRTSVHYGQHSSLWIIPVNPLKAPSAFAEYNARRRVARSPYLPAGEAQKPPFAESEHLRTPPAGNNRHMQDLPVYFHQVQAPPLPWSTIQ